MTNQPTKMFSADDIVVVTGGAGFIGSNISKCLAESGARVVVCDRLGRGDKWRNLSGIALHDVVRPESLQGYLTKIADKIPAVVHMGAISATTEQDADRILQDNIRATLDIWEWTRANDTRLVYASSAATYGDGAKGFRDRTDLAYLSALRPLNAYGWSKAFVDLRAAQEMEREQNLGLWAGLKFFNVYGPGEDHKGDMRSVVNKIIPKILQGETIELFKSHRDIYEDGGQKRDFVYVADCVAITMWLLVNPKISGIFNVGSGKARTFRDLACATFRSLGQEPRIRYVDMPELLRGKYQYFTEADMGKAREAGFIREATSLEDGIDDYVHRWTSLR